MESAEQESVAEAASAACAWDPGFGTTYCYQGDWWIEFAVADATTESMSVEVLGSPASRVVALTDRFALWGGSVKFTGGTGGIPVLSGTEVRLIAQQYAVAGGQTAMSNWFPYRVGAPEVECGPCTPMCMPGACGPDSCGGTCGCDSGDVCLADQTCCTPNDNPCGPDGCGGSHGDCGCVPSCTGQECGDDGCGGSCGSCETGTQCSGGLCVGACVPAWSPLWKQGVSSGSYWTEVEVTGGGSLAKSVSLEVVGGATYPLWPSYRPWVGGLGGVASGTWVVLHATDATGATAHSVPFRYLVDTTPVTDPCLGTPSTTPSCHPLTRGMITFSMDDSNASQAYLAMAALDQYGFKATIYHITDVLSMFGVLPLAQQLAAAGHEVASHTKTHAYLPALSPSDLDNELSLSKSYLLAHVGSPVESFASPMGAYDSAVLAAAKTHYSSHRTVNPGLNYMGSDVHQLKADGVYNSSTATELCDQIAEAATNRGWRIFVFHDFTSAASSPYALTCTMANLDAMLACAQSTANLDVVTIREGASALACASPP